VFRKKEGINAEGAENTEVTEKRGRNGGLLARERKDEEIAFAGGDYGEEAAVRGNGEFAEGEAVEQ
jgi:hypothetical protein